MGEGGHSLEHAASGERQAPALVWTATTDWSDSANHTLRHLQRLTLSSNETVLTGGFSALSCMALRVLIRRPHERGEGGRVGRARCSKRTGGGTTRLGRDACKTGSRRERGHRICRLASWPAVGCRPVASGPPRHVTLACPRCRGAIMPLPIRVSHLDAYLAGCCRAGRWDGLRGFEAAMLRAGIELGKKGCLIGLRAVRTGERRCTGSN